MTSMIRWLSRRIKRLIGVYTSSNEKFFSEYIKFIIQQIPSSHIYRVLKRRLYKAVIQSSNSSRHVVYTTPVCAIDPLDKSNGRINCE